MAEHVARSYTSVEDASNTLARVTALINGIDGYAAVAAGPNTLTVTRKVTSTWAKVLGVVGLLFFLLGVLFFFVRDTQVFTVVVTEGPNHRGSLIRVTGQASARVLAALDSQFGSTLGPPAENQAAWGSLQSSASGEVHPRDLDVLAFIAESDGDIGSDEGIADSLGRLTDAGLVSVLDWQTAEVTELGREVLDSPAKLAELTALTENIAPPINQVELDVYQTSDGVSIVTVGPTTITWDDDGFEVTGTGQRPTDTDWNDVYGMAVDETTGQLKVQARSGLIVIDTGSPPAAQALADVLAGASGTVSQDEA